MVELAETAQVMAQCRVAASDLYLLDPKNELLEYCQVEEGLPAKRDSAQLKARFWDGPKAWDHSSNDQREVSFRVVVLLLAALVHEIERIKRGDSQ